MLDAAIRFLIGGAAVLLATALAEVSQKWAGLIVVFPAISAATIAITYYRLGAAQATKLTFAALAFVLPLFVFLAVLLLTLPKLGFGRAVLIATALWFFATLAIQSVL